ncbi:uncharacterized protein BDV17DRAFT_240042 [Aspergillus undulatus]|uniref:uncharacterized protein n=1 Tax=Aspergillus undulatus TaxID=1810928 RepID=UPI003CCD2DCE
MERTWSIDNEFQQSELFWTRNTGHWHCSCPQHTATIPVFHPFLELIRRALPPNLWAGTLIGPKRLMALPKVRSADGSLIYLLYRFLARPPFSFFDILYTTDTLVLLLLLFINSTRRL